ncbi:alpha-amylase/4-alpha-glucanotransferase domain-containing protein, partial [Shewanella sp. AS1]|uniref:alpha-amylase/4-alpha-glucanotransferase domain-containing protein n=1 Tax=Shewanella sp. AS1 TaxID=2907626 RepID=UPI001F42B758
MNTAAGSLEVLMKRQGTVQAGHTSAALALEKAVILTQSAGSINISYRFVNESDMPIDTTFACEWNINLLGGGHNDAAYYRV